MGVYIRTEQSFWYKQRSWGAGGGLGCCDGWLGGCNWDYIAGFVILEEEGE